MVFSAAVILPEGTKPVGDVSMYFPSPLALTVMGVVSPGKVTLTVAPGVAVPDTVTFPVGLAVT